MRDRCSPAPSRASGHHARSDDPTRDPWPEAGVGATEKPGAAERAEPSTPARRRSPRHPPAARRSPGGRDRPTMATVTAPRRRGRSPRCSVSATAVHTTHGREHGGAVPAGDDPRAPRPERAVGGGARARRARQGVPTRRDSRTGEGPSSRGARVDGVFACLCARGPAAASTCREGPAWPLAGRGTARSGRRHRRGRRGRRRRAPGSRQGPLRDGRRATTVTVEDVLSWRSRRHRGAVLAVVGLTDDKSPLRVVLRGRACPYGDLATRSRRPSQRSGRPTGSSTSARSRRPWSARLARRRSGSTSPRHAGRESLEPAG